MFTRRDLLKHGLKASTLISLAPTVPGFLANLARADVPDKNGRVLVVVQLDGGNDGINTVVPFADEGYAKARKALRLEKKNLVTLNDKVALHTNMREAGNLFEAGKLAIVQGVGYPNPNRSHFESMAIWHSARLDPEEQTSQGWLGRGLDESKAGQAGGTASLYLGSGGMPLALNARHATAASLDRIEDFKIDSSLDPRSAAGSADDSAEDLASFVAKSTLDAYSSSDKLTSLAGSKDEPRYPGTKLGDRLKMVSRLMKGGFEAKVYYTIQGGYDTHAGQLGSHGALLFELSGAIKAFLDDMDASGMGDRATVLCFSEFGRRVAENASEGTDHGTAGPVLIAGKKVKGGLVGETPSLTNLDGGDLKTSIDFRRVYASILTGWLGLGSRQALAGDFEPLPIF